MADFPILQPAQVPADAVVIDVREDDEWAAGHVAGSLHIPLADIPYRLSEIPTDQTVVLVCRSGGRSDRAAQWLTIQGFDVANLEGGLNRWAAQGRQLVVDGDGTPIVL